MQRMHKMKASEIKSAEKLEFGNRLIEHPKQEQIFFPSDNDQGLLQGIGLEMEVDTSPKFKRRRKTYSKEKRKSKSTNRNKSDEILEINL